MNELLIAFDQSTLPSARGLEMGFDEAFTTTAHAGLRLIISNSAEAFCFRRIPRVEFHSKRQKTVF